MLHHVNADHDTVYDFCYISRQVDVADTPNMEISHRPVIHDSVSQRHVTDDGSVNDPVRPGS